jgi:hypothetical protein
VSDGQPATPPTAGPGAGAPCDGTVASCPLGPCQCGSATWLDTQALCGDTVRLQATLTGNCPDGPATIQILHPSNGSVVASINATLTGGRVTASWIAKAQTAQWRTDRIRFRVNAAGVTCTSSNEFTFKKRPVAAFTRRNTNRGTPVGFQAICEKVDAALEANRVHYNLKLRHSSGTFTAAQKAAAKTLIENTWNNGFSGKTFHRTACGRGRACDCAFDCCKCGYRLDVNWVASGEHYPTKVHAAATDTHSYTSCSEMDWADPPIDATTSYPHEVGHALGQFDEYTGGGLDPSGVQPTNPAADNLMKTAGDSTLFTRHYRWALEFLNAKSGGDGYETVPP